MKLFAPPKKVLTIFISAILLVSVSICLPAKNYYINVNGITDTEQKGNRASGCKPPLDHVDYTEHQVVECIVFNNSDCFRKLFKPTGESLNKWTRDISCGYSNVENALIEFEQIKQEGGTFAGEPPDFLAEFSAVPFAFSNGYIYYSIINNRLIGASKLGKPLKSTALEDATKELREAHAIDGNAIYSSGAALTGAVIEGDHGDPGIGGAACIKTDNKYYYDCYGFNEKEHYFLKLAVNGAGVPNLRPESVSRIFDFGYNDIEKAAAIYDKAFIKIGPNPRERVDFSANVSYPWGNRSVVLTRKGFNYGAVGSNYSMGCREKIDDSNYIECFDFDPLECGITVFAINGAVKTERTVLPSDECSLFYEFDKAQEIFDTLNIFTTGPNPAEKRDLIPMPYRNGHGISIEPNTSYNKQRYLAAGDHIRATGCIHNTEIDGSNNYYDCYYFEDSKCSMVTSAKNGVQKNLDLNKAKVEIEDCGYLLNPKKALELYNSIDESHRSGPPPEIKIAKFEARPHGSNFKLYVEDSKGNMTYSSGSDAKLAIGCRDTIDDKVECFSFDYLICKKAIFTMSGGLIQSWLADKTCGYNNFDISNNIYQSLTKISLDKQVRAGDPPNQEPAEFTTGYINGAQVRLLINGYSMGWDYYNILNYSKVEQFNDRNFQFLAGCYPIENNERTCVGFNRDFCYKRKFTAQGYPLQDTWVAAQNCGYDNSPDQAFTEYQKLEPETVTGLIPIERTFAVSQDEDYYYLAIDGTLQQGNGTLSGSLSLGCTAVDENHLRTCFAFEQNKCVWVRYHKIGYQIPGFGWNGGCGYYNYQAAKDKIITLGTTPGPVKQDAIFDGQSIDDNALFKGGLHHDANNPDTKDKIILYINNSPENNGQQLFTKSVGCTPVEGTNEDAKRTCYGFDAFNCYKRDFTRLGKELSEWTVIEDPSYCGYIFYDRALEIYSLLEKETIGGVPPSLDQITLKGVLENGKYYLQFGNETSTDINITEGMGCKQPGQYNKTIFNRSEFNIPSEIADEQIIECIAFGRDSCYRKIFRYNGTPLSQWTPDSTCGFRHEVTTNNLIDLTNNTALEVYEEVDLNLYSGTVPFGGECNNTDKICHTLAECVNNKCQCKAGVCVQN